MVIFKNKSSVKSRGCSLVYMALLLFATGIQAQQLPDRGRAADRYYINLEYAKAADLYASLLKKRDDLSYVKRAAECYRLIHNFPEAEIFYRKELSMEETFGLPRFYYGEVLEQNAKFSEAESQFKLFMPSNQGEVRLKEVRIESCIESVHLAAKETGFKISNLKELNSAYSDFGTSLQDSELLFVSNRPLSKEILKENKEYRKVYGWTDKPFWKLYQTHLDAKGISAKPSLLSPLINSAFNNGPAVINNEGSVIYFSKAEVHGSSSYFSLSEKKKIHSFVNHNGLYFSIRSNGIWTDPVSFPYNDLAHYSISHPALSSDGKTLYFASDMPGGKGGADIYSVEVMPGGYKFGKPVNLGDSINTGSDEEFPSIGPDGSLYFSSNGWVGMGGLDLFRSVYKNGHFSKPENLGLPMNSSKDDFSIIFKKDHSNKGYFSSNRDGGLGDDDIYTFEFEALLPPPDTTSKPVVAKATIKDSLQVFFKTKSLDHIQGKTLEIPNIYYKPGKAELERVDFPVLDRLISLLNLYPNMIIEIRAHTDRTGRPAKNLILSQKRAERVKAYLLSKGINSHRLMAKGFGQKMPLEKCGIHKPCTVKQNQANRRTEIRVLKQ